MYISVSTLSHSGTCQGLFSAAEAHLSTHHGGCSDVPVVVTNRSPLTVLQNLHSPLAYHGSASQTDQGLLQKRDTKNKISGDVGELSFKRWLQVYRIRKKLKAKMLLDELQQPVIQNYQSSQN